MNIEDIKKNAPPDAECYLINYNGSVSYLWWDHLLDSWQACNKESFENFFKSQNETKIIAQDIKPLN